jgi:ribosomal protein L32
MAVPKKKISYSRTRKRFLAKKGSLKLYRQCKRSQNFIPLHKTCSFFDSNSDVGPLTNNNVHITNIEKLYNVTF